MKIYINETTHKIEDIYTNTTSIDLVEFEVERSELLNRDDFLLLRSTFWKEEGKISIGFYGDYDLTENGTKKQYKRFLETGECTLKDREINEKLNKLNESTIISETITQLMISNAEKDQKLKVLEEQISTLNQGGSENV